VSLAMSTEKVLQAIAVEERQLSYEDELNLPG
jgi:hypothetical protein